MAALAVAPATPLTLLVIQSTPFCNINCDYCYLPDRNSKRRLSLETLELIFRRVLESTLVGPRLGVVWHAGEPLVTPLSFYREALDLIARLTPPSCQITHSIQTNGILLSQEWCDFIKERGIQIGVSIDGPAFIHDAHRKTRAGKGTHAAAMRGIRMLQDNHIGFHVIAVVTEDSLEHPDEIFRFFQEHGIHRVGFNIEEIEAENASSSLSQKGTEIRYRKFMQRIFDLAKETRGVMCIREFEQAQNLICQDPASMPPDRKRGTFNHQVTPFGIISVDCDGSFSTFSPELLGVASWDYGDFTFGNVRSDAFESISVTEKFRRVHDNIATGVEQCRRTCEYFEVCGGGAPANKYFEHGSFEAAETMYCRCSIQVPLDVVLADLEGRLASGDLADPKDRI